MFTDTACVSSIESCHWRILPLVNLAAGLPQLPAPEKQICRETGWQIDLPLPPAGDTLMNHMRTINALSMQSVPREIQAPAASIRAISRIGDHRIAI